MHPYTWDNSIKKRFIYTLIFDGGRIYVGHSISPGKRIKAHKREKKESFSCLILDSLDCDQAEARDMEYVWRWYLHLDGWNIIDINGNDFDMSLCNDFAKRMAGNM